MFLIEHGIGEETYPRQTIKVICGYAPGGSSERPVRLLLPLLQKHLRQNVMIENLTGAGGVLAANKVFSSPPDGYTLLTGQPGTLILLEKYLSEIVRYRTKDLTHIYNIAQDDFVLLSHPEVFQTFEEFLGAARKRRLRAAISGWGTHTHLYIVMLEEMIGQKFIIVPFEGGRVSIAALLGKHVDIVGTFISTSYPIIRSGTVKPLMVFSDRRHPTLSPQLPGDRIKILEGIFDQAVKEPEFYEKAKEAGVDVYPLNSKEYLAETEKQYSLLKKYIKVLKGAEDQKTPIHREK
jgi:tripartite-type tricarboxylate transporter receptor subunit TctC